MVLYSSMSVTSISAGSLDFSDRGDVADIVLLKMWWR